MARIEKFTRGAMLGLRRHYRRTNENYSNENIDKSKTHLNYSLAKNEMSIKELNQYLEKRQTLTRENIKVCCSCSITLPSSLSNSTEQEKKLFFEEAYKFLVNRYCKVDGENSVFSSYVHMDETSPHMHFCFIPVYWNEKYQEQRVSAKKLIDRKDLQTLHTDLENHMQDVFGFKVGIQNGQTKGFKTVTQLKQSTQQLEEELKKANEITSEEVDVSLFNYKKTTQKIKDQLDAALSTIETQQYEIERLQGVVFKQQEELERKERSVSHRKHKQLLQEVDALQELNMHLSKQVDLKSVTEIKPYYEKLKTGSAVEPVEHLKFFNMLIELYNTVLSKWNSLKEKYHLLERESNLLKERNSKLENVEKENKELFIENIQLKNELKNNNRINDNLKSFISDTYDLTDYELKTVENYGYLHKSRDYEMER